MNRLNKCFRSWVSAVKLILVQKSGVGKRAKSSVSGEDTWKWNLQRKKGSTAVTGWVCWVEMHHTKDWTNASGGGFRSKTQFWCKSPAWVCEPKVQWVGRTLGNGTCKWKRSTAVTVWVCWIARRRSARQRNAPQHFVSLETRLYLLVENHVKMLEKQNWEWLFWKTGDINQMPKFRSHSILLVWRQDVPFR